MFWSNIFFKDFLRDGKPSELLQVCMQSGSWCC